MKEQADSPTNALQVLDAKSKWSLLDLKDLKDYRDLFYFLTKRDISVRYKQTILGGLWAIIQPVMTMVIFTLFFGRLAKMPSDGIPYPIFVYAGLLPWIYFANALSSAGNSLVGSANLITKVYFPRIIIPASACLAGLVDFFIAMLVLLFMMCVYAFVPGPSILLFPLLVGLIFVCAVGAGLWLSALNVQYRDMRYVIPFVVQLWMFVSPVIYPVSIIEGKYQWLLGLNPLCGIITAFRASLLRHMPVDWSLLALSTAMTFAIFISGLFYFNKMEEQFADVI